MSAIPARRPFSRPFLPSEVRRDKPGAALERAAVVSALHAIRYEKGDTSLSLEQLASRLYPNDDRLPGMVTRGAVAPATTTTTGWAAELSQNLVADFVGSLGAQSAGSRLIDAGLRLSLDGVNQLLIPQRTGAPDAGLAWVGEGNAFPVKMFALADATLGPARKLVASAAVTRETVESGNGQEVVATLLREDCAASLDASLFSATAASSTRPAGLLAGVSGLTATTGGGPSALNSDLEKLAAAIAAAGGDVDNVVFIASPAQAFASGLQSRAADLKIWPSRALAAGTIVAVNAAAFVSGFGSTPRIEASMEATFHAEDTSPLPISTAGSPNTVAAPVRSGYQTDTILIRAILFAAWTMRSSGQVQFITSATW
jgi:hypothetical protein